MREAVAPGARRLRSALPRPPPGTGPGSDSGLLQVADEMSGSRLDAPDILHVDRGAIASVSAWATRAFPLPIPVQRLAEEVRTKGWIVFSATIRAGRLGPLRLPAGWIGTPEHHAAPPTSTRRRRSSRATGGGSSIAACRRGDDRRQPLRHPGRAGHCRGRRIEPRRRSARAGEYPWASWSPDGEQLACLTIKGIAIVDVASRRVVRTLPRKGFFQQMTWSPDGKWLSGVANSFGASWSVARMDVATGAASGRQRRRLLHARLVPGQSGRHLLEPPAGPDGEQRQRLDPALDGRPRRQEPPARLRRGRPARLRRPASRPTASTSSSPATCKRTAIPGHSGAPDGPHAAGRCTDHRRREPGAPQAPSEAKSGPVLDAPGGMGAVLDVRPRSRPARRSSARRPATLPTAVDAALAAEVRREGLDRLQRPDRRRATGTSS